MLHNLGPTRRRSLSLVLPSPLHPHRRTRPSMLVHIGWLIFGRGDHRTAHADYDHAAASTKEDALDHPEGHTYQHTSEHGDHDAHTHCVCAGAGLATAEEANVGRVVGQAIGVRPAVNFPFLSKVILEVAASSPGGHEQQHEHRCTEPGDATADRPRLQRRDRVFPVTVFALAQVGRNDSDDREGGEKLCATRFRDGAQSREGIYENVESRCVLACASKDESAMGFE